jgi:hypothetical protein
MIRAGHTHSLQHMKKTLDTEEIVISSLLLLCGAIATVTRYILIPAVCLILALLGWRPPATAAPTSISRMELEEAALFPALMPPANRDNRVELLMGELQTIAPCDWKAREALIRRVQEARIQQEARIRLARETSDLEAQEAIVDRWNDYRSEVPTAEDRSPSLRRRNR